jgi:hypothetical protein
MVAEGASLTIGQVTPSGTVTEFQVGMGTSVITPGADGNMWFSGGYYYSGTTNIGKITTAGVPTVYTLPFQAFQAIGIVTGPTAISG